MATKEKYYSLKNILHKGKSVGALYYLIYGERSNGKTYACKELGLNGYQDKEVSIEGYLQNGSQMAYVRRWQDDFTGKRGATLFDDLVANGSIEKWTKGKWNNVYYYSGRWYLSRYDADTEKTVRDDTPFCYAFAISTMEHDKSTSYPKVDKIVFDEFLTRTGYISNDEFTLFMNVVSTIVRDRNNVKIFMLGNTVNAESLYFNEMGLDNIKHQPKGTIDVYNYGESGLHVVVEYADTSARRKKDSDVYFAFNNPKLSMITSGNWEMSIYPHCPCKFKPKHIKFTYFICFSGETLQCEIVYVEGKLFTYIHQKTTPIKDTDKDLIYCCDYNPKPNYRRKLSAPISELEKKLWWFYGADKVYYQDNPTGEIVRNYLEWCYNDKLV